MFLSKNGGSSNATSPDARGASLRERLEDGSQLSEWRAAELPGYVIRSDAEIEASLEETLASQSSAGDIWVFGYGSLIWNPTFESEEQRVALVRGWHRRFCLWSMAGRGTPDVPGLMLALDRGGSCRGVVFRLAARKARDELLLLWRREMASGVYLARWVDVRLGSWRQPAITFVADRRHARYTNRLSDTEIASRIALARGSFGTCREYFANTIRTLGDFGVSDAGLERIRRHVAVTEACE